MVKLKVLTNFVNITTFANTVCSL